MGILIRLPGTSFLQYHFLKGRKNTFQLAHVDCADADSVFGSLFSPRLGCGRLGLASRVVVWCRLSICVSDSHVFGRFVLIWGLSCTLMRCGFQVCKVFVRLLRTTICLENQTNFLPFQIFFLHLLQLAHDLICECVCLE